MFLIYSNYNTVKPPNIVETPDLSIASPMQNGLRKKEILPKWNFSSSKKKTFCIEIKVRCYL